MTRQLMPGQRAMVNNVGARASGSSRAVELPSPSLGDPAGTARGHVAARLATLYDRGRETVFRSCWACPYGDLHGVGQTVPGHLRLRGPRAGRPLLVRGVGVRGATSAGGVRHVGGVRPGVAA